MVLLVLILAAAVQVAYFYPKMPATMASHFGADGRANGFMSRDGFVEIYIFVIGLMAVMFFLLPKGILKFPDSMINLPNKQYWLAPERRAQTGETIARYMAEAGNATITLFLIVFQFAFRANTSTPHTLPGNFWLIIVAFGGYMVVWMARFVGAFRLPPEAKAP